MLTGVINYAPRVHLLANDPHWPPGLLTEDVFVPMLACSMTLSESDAQLLLGPGGGGVTEDQDALETPRSVTLPQASPAAENPSRTWEEAVVVSNPTLVAGS